MTIDGQDHTITRDTHFNPASVLKAVGDETGAGVPEEHYTGAILQIGAGDTVTLKNVTIDGEGNWAIDQEKLEYDKLLNQDYDINVLDDPNGSHPITELEGNVISTDSLIKVAGGTLKLDGVTLENFFAGDGYDDDRHFIDFTNTEDGKLEIVSNTIFQHNASRSGVCIGNTDDDVIELSNCTTMQENYCYGGNGGLVVAMEGTQVYMEDGSLKKEDGVETKPANCTEDGEMTFTCTGGCKTEITIPIPATGHQYPNPKDADYETNTNYVVIDEKKSTCSTAGYIKYAAVCTVCGAVDNSYTYQVNLEKLQHEWTECEDVDKDTKYPCTAERIGGETTHTWDDPEDKNKEGYTVDEKDTFYVCNDYHLPGENATLLAREAGAQMIHREKAVLIGWSAAPHDVVKSTEDVDGLPITEVSLTGAASNAKVYALWAADVNKNSVADYQETTLEHTYHQNQFLADGNSPQLIGGDHLDVQMELLPPFTPSILPGMPIELAANNSLGEADVVDRDGAVVGDHYMQVGWSATSHSACTTLKEYRNWVIGVSPTDTYPKEGTTSRVIYDTRYENAYTVWTIDNNTNKTPDFMELMYTITLDLNGGTGGSDFQETTELFVGEDFTFPTDPTKAGCKFLDCSSDGGKTLYKAGDDDQLMWWFLLLAASGIGIVAVCAIRPRPRHWR